jgi:hypothetical protein
MAPHTRVPCDVTSLPPDAAAVDLLARLQLAARRHGREVRLSGASAALRELIAFFGLAGVLEREPKEGEEPLGVEEERQLDDPAL